MTVELSVESGVAHLVLDRPQRRNAIDTALADAFVAAVERARQAGASVIVLRARPPAFCAGNDLDDLGPSDVAQAPATRVVDCITASDVFWMTVVEGSAIGGALSILAVSHLVLATEQARFQLPEATMGLFPSAIYGHLEQVIGPRQAFLAGLSGNSYDADQALDLGLVSELVDSALVDARIADWTKTLLASPGSLRAATRAWSNTFTGPETRSRRRYLDGLLDEQFREFSPRRPA